MNDPRISSVADAQNLTDVSDSVLLDTPVVLVGPSDWGDKTVRDIHAVMSARSPVELWVPASGRHTTVNGSVNFNLNAGLTFSTYSGIAIIYDNHGASNAADAICLSSFFPRGTYDVGDRLQVHTVNQWKQIEIVTDSSFTINSGGSGLGIKGIYGFY